MQPEATQELIQSLALEIKRREHVLKVVIAENQRLLYPAVSIEFCYLQFRKILELLAFSAVAANAGALKRVGKSLKTDFHADKVFRWLEAHYKKSYPEPIVEKLDPRPGIKADLESDVFTLTHSRSFGGSFGILAG